MKIAANKYYFELIYLVFLLLSVDFLYRQLRQKKIVCICDVTRSLFVFPIDTIFHCIESDQWLVVVSRRAKLHEEIIYKSQLKRLSGDLCTQ